MKADFTRYKGAKKMFEKTVVLSEIGKVRSFVALCNTFSYDIWLVSGKKKVNAKSIIGIFSLDLTKPVTVIADTEQIAAISRKLEPFGIK